MTLSEIATLCPPPEGMEWKDQSFRGEAHFYLSHLCPPGGCTVMREPGGWTVYASAGNASAQFVLVTDEDLPAAYLRALQAVGLAPDAEKEDMRRRLTWTSEVPTEPGVYVVGRGVKPYDGSIMFRRWDEDEGKMERPWVDAFGLPWTDEQMKGRRFFALDNLKETP